MTATRLSSASRQQLLGFAKLVGVLAIGVFAAQTLWWVDAGMPIGQAMAMTTRVVFAEASAGLADLLDAGDLATALDEDF